MAVGINPRFEIPFKQHSVVGRVKTLESERPASGLSCGAEKLHSIIELPVRYSYTTHLTTHI